MLHYLREVLVIHLWVGINLALVLLCVLGDLLIMVTTGEVEIAPGEARGCASIHRVPWLAFFLVSEPRTHTAIVW